MRSKTIASGVRIKDADAGTFSAVIATLDVVDRDGDVMRKEAFTDGADVVVSAYGHRSHFGELPVGRGTLTVTDTEAVVDGKFLLATPHGRDTFETVKELGDLQEWSFSLDQVTEHRETIDGQPVNVITDVYVKEVSPVLQGAGINTRTLATKTAKRAASQTAAALRDAGRDRWGADDVYVWLEDYDPDRHTAIYDISPSDGAAKLVEVGYTLDEGPATLDAVETEVERTVVYRPVKGDHRFSEHARSVLADLGELTTRARDVMALRAAKGKTIAEDTRTAIADIGVAAKALVDAVEPATDDAGPGRDEVLTTLLTLTDFEVSTP